MDIFLLYWDKCYKFSDCWNAVSEYECMGYSMDIQSSGVFADREWRFNSSNIKRLLFYAYGKDYWTIHVFYFCCFLYKKSNQVTVVFVRGNDIRVVLQPANEFT